MDVFSDLLQLTLICALAFALLSKLPVGKGLRFMGMVFSFALGVWAVIFGVIWAVTITLT